MTTPAILNLTATQQGATPAAKQYDSAPPEVPFKQVLSREIAGNRDAAKTQHPAQAQAAAAKPASSTHAAAKPAGKSAEQEKTEKTDDTSPNPDAAAQAMPSDLLALVASINQLTPAADAAGAPVDTDVLASAKADAIAGPGAGDARTKVDPALTGAEGDFAAAMEDLAADADGAGLAVKPDAVQLAADARDAASLTNTNALASLQHAAAHVAHAAAHVAHAAPGRTDRLAPHVGSAGWDQALGQKVVWMAAGAEQSATLTLNPPDLGPLQVVLNVSNAQATAMFVAGQAEVRQALEDAMPKLREMLGQAGIELGQASVSSGNPGQNGDGGQPGPRHGRGLHGGVDDGVTAVVPARGRAISSGQGLVDTFV